MRCPQEVRIEVLVFEGDPRAEAALEVVRRVAERLAPGAAVVRVEVATAEKAAALGFPDSPSLRVNGLLCRFSPDEGAGGLAPWRVEAGLLRALEPRSLLFLCVANSARSQMAEGVARHLLGSSVRVQSAGSEPSQVRAEAIEVLAEIGIDISSHRSKSVETIDPDSVDVVIALCAEEVCPAFLGKARRLDWGLPDPAAVGGSGRLGAFRETRDELYRRLALLAGRNREEP